MPPPKEKVGRPAVWPHGYEVELAKAIADVVAAMEEQARAEIAAHGQALVAQTRARSDEALREDLLAELLVMILLRIALAVGDRVEALVRSIPFFGRRLAAWHAKDFTEVVVTIYGTDVYRGGELWLEDVERTWEQENIALVRSVPEQYTNRLRADFNKAAMEGRGVDGLTEAVDAASKAGKARAAVIARDQVGRLMVQLSEQRHRDAGVSRYRWVTMLDERVRPTHQVRHGKIFSWSDPGIKPGSEINCRCVSAGVFPPLTATRAS